MKRIFAFLMLSAVLFIAGCGAHDGVVSKADVSWLSFVGDTRGAMVSIDDAAPFLLRPAGYDKKQPKPQWYEVSPGRHTVVITRNDAVIVHREVLVGTGQTKEILVP
ncbi:hypothetical protein [Desulfovibrio psychrotolerans]|uniref:Lipoprotein n=1 Tax=Desulfovibrio psychrotolerans TaxID=415242 RepID=A0A7J0BYP1_9BACT|nr:hypothetical protein [Desulfovibrio psychrotolerans]GFM38271.1 hypothetical protein DSM19430T_29550 [Desulfovibrio psychrotolerans]